ncbi:MAG: aspartyl/asparaginyl beta-hydroxylase domain-containing protein [Rivularia sp. T60_A2020_040]|nr:aspartyl/asparaginyl beta-hydroxylase domain-containing protein [Rivularia sp. T60_A2020_040]
MQDLSKIIVKQLEKLLTKDGWLETLVANNSKIGNSVFFDVEQFPWAKDLEANWMVIRQELEQVLERVDELPNFQDISKRQYRIANDNLWKTYFFYAFGFKATRNCERCPETTKLIEQIPGMKVAFFSILAPGKHIPRHRGKLKTLIRYHLGLIVPEPKEKCKIQIADEIRYWQEGKSLIFDDTFYHEVWNDTDGYRVVLFLDIVRPLKFPLSVVSSLANKFIAASPIVQEAKASHNTWENKFEKEQKSQELIS